MEMRIRITANYRNNIYNKCEAILNANSRGRSCDFLDGYNGYVGLNVADITNVGITGQ